MGIVSDKVALVTGAGAGIGRSMAVSAVALRDVSIALPCRAFGVSETCYRYGPKSKTDNEQIADLLLGLTKARKTWSFGLSFLYLRTSKRIHGTTNAFIGFSANLS